MKTIFLAALLVSSASVFAAETCSVYAKLQLSGFIVKSTCTEPRDAYNCTYTNCSYPSSVSSKGSAYSFLQGHIMGQYSDVGYTFASERVTSYFQKEIRRGLRTEDADSNDPKEFAMTFIKP